MSRIAVIGIGNVLMGDDAFGPYVAQLLDAWFAWPDGVQVVEIGTQGLDLTPYVRGADALVAVSTIHRGSVPGTLQQLARTDILDADLPNREPSLRNSPYEPGLRNLLLTLEFTGGAPREAWVVGATPATVELTGRLSEPVRAALQPTVEAVVAITRTLGALPRERLPRAPVTPWWEVGRG